MSMRAFFDRLSPFGYPLIRIATGAILMPHGAQKLFGWFGGYGLAGTGQFFETSLGMSPGYFWALVAGLIEFFGGLALVLGFLTRPAALAIAVFMGVAMSTHIANGFFWPQGGFEYPLLWGLIALGIFLHGGNGYSLDAKFRMPF
ncbi:MAG TPA: DoxX family protein [Gammaproteobacteria bacterium]